MSVERVPVPQAEVEVEAMTKPGMGRGLAAILPETAEGEPELRELPVELIRPQPAPAADAVRPRLDQDAWRRRSPTPAWSSR